MSKTRETAIVNKIRDALKKRGVLCFKWHGSVMGQTGMPDLLAIVDGRAIWLEVKTATGDTTKLQVHMLAKMREAGCVAAVVRSVDEALEAIEGATP